MTRGSVDPLKWQHHLHLIMSCSQSMYNGWSSFSMPSSFMHLDSKSSRGIGSRACSLVLTYSRRIIKIDGIKDQRRIPFLFLFLVYSYLENNCNASLTHLPWNVLGPVALRDHHAASLLAHTVAHVKPYTLVVGLFRSLLKTFSGHYAHLRHSQWQPIQHNKTL